MIYKNLINKNLLNFYLKKIKINTDFFKNTFIFSKFINIKNYFFNTSIRNVPNKTINIVYYYTYIKNY
ncbi:hypothetical protein D9V65_00120 [Buchnera aphidicola (Anoecia oenotherae)]|uniref:Uncharacterized protein n=1 Tax=Buchnera aphidicola (Anoecia oenotherae) TaxID=1241833 RepID=A0A4D6XUX9_9GAMM|nr:hypothetical protein D9V65_00120 [Buchnera aphidicola (Anoecia oenotherae)]